jgi:hypothetical protein
MQALGTPVPDDAKEIFNLLASQKFHLIVTLLNTIVDTNVIVTQTVGLITQQLSTVLSVPIDGCLAISCNLTANIATITLTILSSQAIGGVAISLWAPGIVGVNNQVKELNFSYSFTMLNRTMSQQPSFDMELIQVINETKPLSSSAASQYSGLWIPAFSQDEDLNFQTQSYYEQYHINPSTILTIDISQADYYIYNSEQPIIRSASVIFKNLLFASMCLEIFAFAFLFFKLFVIPVLKIIRQLIWSEFEESKEENENEESEKEEEEEHESEDDSGEMPQQIEFELGTNEWYTPNVKS